MKVKSYTFLLALLLAGCSSNDSEPRRVEGDDLRPDHSASPADESQYRLMCTCECWVRPETPLCDCDEQTVWRRAQAEQTCPDRGYSKESVNVDP